MKKLILSAVAAIALLGAPAFAQTVKLGAELEVTEDKRSSVLMEVSKPYGPVVASLELRSTLAKDNLRSSSDLTGGVRYDSPIVLWGATPFVKGELGVSTSAKNRNFWGAEVGAFGAFEGPYSWEAAYRFRDPSGGDDENRTRFTTFYSFDENLKVGGSVLVWETDGDKTIGFGVEAAKKF